GRRPGQACALGARGGLATDCSVRQTSRRAERGLASALAHAAECQHASPLLLVLLNVLGCESLASLGWTVKQAWAVPDRLLAGSPLTGLGRNARAGCWRSAVECASSCRTMKCGRATASMEARAHRGVRRAYPGDRGERAL